jgi:hypothetical protein
MGRKLNALPLDGYGIALEACCETFIPLEDVEWDSFLLECLGKKQTSKPGTNDEDVRLCHFEHSSRWTRGQNPKS